jgi:hypothetical protein
MKALFKDIEIGTEFWHMGLTYIKKSSITARLKDGRDRDWDYFAKNTEIVISDKQKG